MLISPPTVKLFEGQRKRLQMAIDMISTSLEALIIFVKKKIPQ